MPNLSHKDAIKQYYELEKHKYPHVSFEQFEEMCMSPFKAVKAWFRANDLPIINIKWLGKFVARESTIRKLMNENEVDYHIKHRLHLDEARYLKIRKFYQDYLEEIRKEQEGSGLDIELIDDEEETTRDTEG